MKKIREIEKQLTTIIEKDKRNWTSFYVLLKQVEEKKLWGEIKDCKSFTAWVKDFSQKSNIHESVIWNRKKAGELYQKYADIKKAKNKTVAPIEEINIAVDSLVLVDKIAVNNDAVIVDLTEKAINKEITRDDLREAYKIVRSARKKSKEKSEKNIDNIDKKDNKNNEHDNIEKTSVDASKILTAIKKSETWLKAKERYNRFVSSSEQYKFRIFAEFPVKVPTTRSSRRIDALVVENLTTKSNREVYLHAIEIKANKYDLINDKKFTEYAAYADFTWLAVPNYLIKEAEEVVFTGCGILVLEDGILKVHRPATKMEAPLKLDTLMRLTIRLM